MIYERKSRPAGNETAPSASTAGDSAQHIGLASWRRRHDAARRVEPHECGHADPWVCDHHDGPLTEQAIDGARAAALHILETGSVPVLTPIAMQALWRRGGTDRELAVLLRKMTDGQVV